MENTGRLKSKGTHKANALSDLFGDSDQKEVRKLQSQHSEHELRTPKGTLRKKEERKRGSPQEIPAK